LLFKKASTFLSNLSARRHPLKWENVNIYAATDIGLVRENNEDSYFCLPKQQIWAVLDGMGGHESGETASAIAVYSFKNAIIAGKSTPSAIENAHQAIEQAAIEGIGSKGMGATIVTLELDNNHYEISWIGDSRAYCYRSKLTQLSKDHSYIQLMLDQGLISEAEIENHPYKNTITQALGGIGTEIKVDTVTGEIQQGDIYLLCSDGLTGEVPDLAIEQTLSNQQTTLEQKGDQLINQALASGGKDNVTLILVEIGDSSTAT
jgi:protein phosphatase